MDNEPRDAYYERIMAAKDIAQKIVALCESYERAPSQMVVNKLLTSVEHLADLAEDIEADQTNRILDG